MAPPTNFFFFLFLMRKRLMAKKMVGDIFKKRRSAIDCQFFLIIITPRLVRRNSLESKDIFKLSIPFQYSVAGCMIQQSTSMFFFGVFSLTSMIWNLLLNNIKSASIHVQAYFLLIKELIIKVNCIKSLQKSA